MSQIYKSGASGPVPPIVATSYTTDIRNNDGTLTPGHAIPSGNVLIVKGRESSQNNINGIRTDADTEGSNNLFIELTNRATGTGTTTGATDADIITFDLGATPGVYTFDIKVSGFAHGGFGSPLGTGYTIVGGVRTDGLAGTLLPTQVVDHFEEGALGVAPQATAKIVVTGNDAIVRVTGKTDGGAGFAMNWSATLNYNFVS